MGAVSVHFDQDVVAVAQSPVETGHIGCAEAVLGVAVEHVHARIGRCDPIGDLPGAVGARVVDDQEIHVRVGRA